MAAYIVIAYLAGLLSGILLTFLAIYAVRTGVKRKKRNHNNRIVYLAEYRNKPHDKKRHHFKNSL